jgi:hypothetical protein
MIKLSDLADANSLLVSMGGEDQMPRIAAVAVERNIELQARIERALSYAAAAPPNSMHARNMARILDGSITVDDELNEVHEHDVPMRVALHRDQPDHRGALPAPAPAPVKRTRGPNKKPRKAKAPPASRYESGLADRSSAQRREFRKWMAANGYEVPAAGPVSPDLVAIYDNAMEQARLARVAANRRGEDQLPL